MFNKGVGAYIRKKDDFFSVFIANILQWGRFRSPDLYAPVMSDTCYHQLHCATAGWVSPEQVGWTCYIIFHVAQSRSHPPDFIEGRER